MKDRRAGSKLTAMGASLAVFAACGAKSGLDLDPVGGGQGASFGIGGSLTSGNGGTAATGGSGVGGAGGVTLTGGSSTGGACSIPDFVFTTEPDQAVTYMINPQHTGAQLATSVAPPLSEIWRHKFDAGVSYPVLADSRVFATVNSAIGVSSGGVVHAFDAQSGATLWISEVIEADSPHFAVHLAYDRGVLFAAGSDGNVVAFEPSNGNVVWKTTIDEIASYASIPVASGGAVFLTGATGLGSTLFVLDACDGHLLRSGNASGHPTLGSGMLFSTSGCNESEAIDPRDGSVLWHYDEGCFGGGGDRSAFQNDILYVGDSATVPVALDVTVGEPLFTLDEPALMWPVSVAGSDLVIQSLYVQNYALKSFDPVNGTRRWDVALPGAPQLPVLLTPGYAYVLTGGEREDKSLSAIDLSTREIWQHPEPTVPYDSNRNDMSSSPFQAMAAAGGRIVVAFDDSLVAYTHVEGSSCGDGDVERDEVCDDGNTAGGDYCSADCRQVTGRCGDGIVQDNETCDGPPPNEDASCNDTCHITFDGVMLAAGSFHTCGLRRDGSITCWGSSEFLDDLPPGIYRHISAHESWSAGLLTNGTPVFWGRFSTVSPGVGPFIKLEAGQDTYCALREDGRLECSDDLRLPSPAGRYAELSMFSDDVCALTAGGELDCFHLGIGLRWGGTFRAVAVGGDDTCAIRDDGTLFCSGDVEPPPGEFTAVSAGYYYHCGLRTNGEIACWGMLTARNSVSLSPPPGKFALIDAGWQHACAIRTDGVTVCWGANEGGQSTPPSDFP